jgi:hypothetical protein
MPSLNSFGSAATLNVGGSVHQIYRLAALEQAGFSLSRIPYSIRVLLENLLRSEDGITVRKSDIEYVARWDRSAVAQEINFRPARVILQDFTGVPCVADIAAMRDALVKMGADPKLANPLIPVDLVIDHSVQVDNYGTAAGEFLELPCGASWHGHCASGEPGVFGLRDVFARRRGVPGFRGGYRFAHDDDQRSGCGGLGCGRH